MNHQVSIIKGFLVKMKKNKSIRTTLKKGTNLGFCYYNGQEEMNKTSVKKAIKNANI